MMAESTKGHHPMTTATRTTDHAFFAGRACLERIATLWELGTFAERPYAGDLEDLSPAAREMADDEGWDVTGDRVLLAEQIRDHVTEIPLSLLVRSDWHVPGGESTYSQFELLLSTGGPAIRILGELDSYCEPYRPALQFSDWGVSWTDHPESNIYALLWFARHFYYGEG
jgi:hypothetical protein